MRDGHEQPLGLAQRHLALTERELEVLALSAGGHSVRRIAHDLGLSRSSVRSRLEGARRKLVMAMEGER